MAAKTSSPETARPALMLCQLVDKPFDDPRWLYEPKLDGLRVLCESDGRQWTLTSRNGKRQSYVHTATVSFHGRIYIPFDA